MKFTFDPREENLKFVQTRVIHVSGYGWTDQLIYLLRQFDMKFFQKYFETRAR